MFSFQNFQSLSTISLMGFFFVFLVGIATVFNPRSMALVSMIAGYVAGSERESPVNKTFRMVLAFVLGMTIADVALGILFAYIGRGAMVIFGPKWDLFLGFLLIVIGLRWLRVFRFQTIGFDIQGKKANSFIGAFILGIPFSMSFCPFCIPYLLSILTIAAATGHVWYSALLMFFFSLGRGLPLMAAGISLSATKRMQFLQSYIPFFEKAGGAILVFVGIYYLYSFSQYLTVS